MYTRITFLFLVALVAVATGCGSESSGSASSGTAVDGSKYLLAAEPEGALDVKQFLQDAKDGDEVVVVGRVGGEVKPWVEGLAAFNLADLSLVACNDNVEDHCPTPWDYCCEPDLAEGRTLVQVVDSGGNVVSSGAKELLKIKELQTVVVKGRADRDDSGSVSLLATGVYVRP